MRNQCNLLMLYKHLSPVWNLQVLGVHKDLRREKKQNLHLQQGPADAHSGHNLFQLLPFGRHYRALFAKTVGHQISFHKQSHSLTTDRTDQIVRRYSQAALWEDTMLFAFLLFDIYLSVAVILIVYILFTVEHLCCPWELLMTRR